MKPCWAASQTERPRYLAFPRQGSKVETWRIDEVTPEI
jgi:hypothetical protein